MYQCSKKLVTYKKYSCFDHFRHIQFLHLMYAEIVWVLVSSGTQVQPQVILDSDYLPEYLSDSYDYDFTKRTMQLNVNCIGNLIELN